MSAMGRPAAGQDERPLLVTAAALVGAVLGPLAVLRGTLLIFVFLAVRFHVAPRDLPLLVLVPAGALVLAGAVGALRSGQVALLLSASWALLGVDLFNGATYALGGAGFPVIDVLSGVMTAVLLFLLHQPQVRRYRTTARPAQPPSL